MDFRGQTLSTFAAVAASGLLGGGDVTGVELLDSGKFFILLRRSSQSPQMLNGLVIVGQRR